MRAVLLLAVSLALAFPATARAEIRDASMRLEDGTELLYGISVPAGYEATQPRPLVLALHPGGGRMRYYGSAYARMVVEPAVSRLGAFIVAPDCTWPGWADPAAERAVMTLLDRVMREYAIDRRRVLVTGFSMGGRGTWFMASRHRDLFTASIPMAASTGDAAVDALATMPTYIIHSRRDQVVPFAPAERNARELERLGRAVHFEALSEPTHFDMTGYVPALRRAIEWVTARWSAAP